MPFIAAAHIRRNSAHGVAGAVIARQRRTGLVRSSAGVQMATSWLRPNVRHEESPSRRQARRRPVLAAAHIRGRSEEHTSELQSLMRISYAVFCLKKKQQK